MKAKGKISKVWIEEFTSKEGKEYKRHFVFLEGNTTKYGGFGSIPEGWIEGKEVEFEYEEKNGYFNIQQKQKKGYSNFSDVIKALTMPKVSIYYERTIQVKQYEPKKVGATITVCAEKLDPKQIQEMIQVAKAEVENELSGKSLKTEMKSEELIPDNFGEETKPGNSEIDQAMRKV